MSEKNLSKHVMKNRKIELKRIISLGVTRANGKLRISQIFEHSCEQKLSRLNKGPMRDNS